LGLVTIDTILVNFETKKYSLQNEKV